ncbi:MAG: DUF4249 family protein [Ignavibacteriales bacterium]|nr:DUF4249 family protein [Ignavibacteriales bacterium]
MKKNLPLFIIAITLSFLNISCEENFSPKEDFKERNILYCIIAVDQYLYYPLYPIVMLTKTYDNPTYTPPKDNKTAPSISGAQIRLKINGIGNGYSFLEDTLDSREFKPYMPEIYYKLADAAGLTLTYGAALSLSITLPDGKILEAKTRIPSSKGFEYSYPFYHGITTLIDQWRWGKSWIISWNAQEGNLYFPKLIMYYTKNSIPPPKNSFIIEIPMRYIKKANGNLPVYPSYSRESSVSYDYSAIDSLMVQISAGDPDKSDYLIDIVKFELLEFDYNLSNYYSSLNGYLDDYSIRLDESTYTNVSGGIGILGTSLISSEYFFFDKKYVESFGYKN